MKFLYSSPSEPEVGLLKSLLDEAGIACEIRNESNHPNLPGAAFQPEVWVTSDGDYARACQVRDAFQVPTSTVPQASSAGLRAWTGLLLLVAAGVFAWQSARLARWASLAGALILFGLTGIVLLLSAIPELVRRNRK
jgi:hypothetical protein